MFISVVPTESVNTSRQNKQIALGMFCESKHIWDPALIQFQAVEWIEQQWIKFISL